MATGAAACHVCVYVWSPKKTEVAREVPRVLPSVIFCLGTWKERRRRGNCFRRGARRCYIRACINANLGKGGDDEEASGKRRYRRGEA